jgi:hypothetical protein
MCPRRQIRCVIWILVVLRGFAVQRNEGNQVNRAALASQQLLLRQLAPLTWLEDQVVLEHLVERDGCSETTTNLCI